MEMKKEGGRERKKKEKMGERKRAAEDGNGKFKRGGIPQAIEV